jgi:hypothetical protein
VSATAPGASLSVLARATRRDVVREPFPYLVLRDALEPSLFARLEREYPEPPVVPAVRHGLRYLRSAAGVIHDPGVSPVWQAFFAYHTSSAFWLQVIACVFRAIVIARSDAS